MRRVCLLLVCCALTGCGQSSPTAPLEQADARAQVESYRIGDAHIEMGVASINGDKLFLSFHVLGKSNRKTIAFTSWSASGATAHDDVGNGYSATSIGLWNEKDIKDALEKQGDKMGFGSGPLTSDRPRLDVVAFSRPPPAATKLTVTLSGENVGVLDKTVTFTVTRELWAK